MRVGSLFAGIGGFDLGFERAGMETAWQVEQDPYCRAVLAKHFPDAKRFEDVCDVGAHNLEPVELICGGFPCQDLSNAGNGAGIDGARSGLWAEFARIIGELRPRYVVVENVTALTRNEWLGRVLGDLAARGYDAEWDCIPASAIGAPHRRDRIWLVAYAAGERPAQGREGGRVDGEGRRTALDNGSTGKLAYSPGNGCGQGRQGRSAGDGEDGENLAPQGVADPEGQSERPGLRQGQPRGERGRRSGDGGGEGDAADADGERCEGTERPGSQAERRRQALDEGGPQTDWSTEPDVGRVADGVPARVDRLSALGNALVPQIAEWIGRRILDYERRVTP